MASLSAAQIPDSFRKVWKVSPENLIGFTVVAYFSGWHYANEYFSYFSVNRSSFSFDDYTVFLYSFFILVSVSDVLYEGTWCAVRDAWNAVRDEGVGEAVRGISSATYGVIALVAMLLVSALRIPAGAESGAADRVGRAGYRFSVGFFRCERRGGRTGGSLRKRSRRRRHSDVGFLPGINGAEKQEIRGYV